VVLFTKAVPVQLEKWRDLCLLDEESLAFRENSAFASSLRLENDDPGARTGSEPLSN